jgi:hypothetical protein
VGEMMRLVPRRHDDPRGHVQEYLPSNQSAPDLGAYDRLTVDSSIVTDFADES